MPDEPVTSCDLGPRDLYSWRTWALATKAVFLLALIFVKLDYIDQPTMSGRVFEALCEIWVFMVKPLSDGLVRIATTKSGDDFPVVAVSPDGF